MKKLATFLVLFTVGYAWAGPTVYSRFGVGVNNGDSLVVNGISKLKILTTSGLTTLGDALADTVRIRGAVDSLRVGFASRDSVINANGGAAFRYWAGASATLAPNIYLEKSRGAKDVYTIVASGDTVGRILFTGSNNTGFTRAAQIVGIVSGTPAASNDMPGSLLFFTTADGAGVPTEVMRITHVPYILSGKTTSAAHSFYPAFQINPFLQGFYTTYSAQSLEHWANGAWGPRFFMSAGRSTTPGTMTVITANDTLGTIAFEGADGTNLELGAMIQAVNDSTPAADKMQTALLFKTSKAGRSPIENMRLSGNGRLTHDTDGTMTVGDSSFTEWQGGHIGGGLRVDGSLNLNGTGYTGTAANLNTLTDDSMADALHRQSELSASDGTPSPVFSVNSSGDVGLGMTTPSQFYRTTNAGSQNSVDLGIHTATTARIGLAGYVNSSNERMWFINSNASANYVGSAFVQGSLEIGTAGAEIGSIGLGTMAGGAAAVVGVKLMSGVFTIDNDGTMTAGDSALTVQQGTHLVGGTVFGGDLLPGTDNGPNIGSVAATPDTIFAHVALVVGDIPYLDMRDDVGDIRKIKPMVDVDTLGGIPLVDDNTLPRYIMLTHSDDAPARLDTLWTETQIKEDSTLVKYEVPVDSTGVLNEVSPVYEYQFRTERTVDKVTSIPAHAKGDLVLKSNGKPFYNPTALDGLLLGAVRQMAATDDSLRTRIGMLEGQLSDFAARVAKLEGQ